MFKNRTICSILTVASLSFIITSYYIHSMSLQDMERGKSLRFKEELHKKILIHTPKNGLLNNIKSIIKKEMDMSDHLAESVSKSIYTYTKDSTISPKLIIAVMKIESHGRHNVVSNKGAIGLMQVMPFWKRELDMDHEDMFNTDTNIKMGVAVLDKYIKQYKTIDKALSAYNGSLGSSVYTEKVMKVYNRISKYNEA